MLLTLSGRLQTISLKAKSTDSDKPKEKGAAKGSWGKPGPKAAAAKAVESNEAAPKVILSSGTSGFEIPVSSRMFESDRI